jgi:hypothetical protein
MPCTPPPGGVELEQRRWRDDMPRQYLVAEAWCEALELSLDA